jgi:probable HAF family extracellular repeat protein
MRVIGPRSAVLVSLATAVGLGVAAISPAQAQQGRPTMYRVTQLGSLGGTASAGASINNVGWVAGNSNMPGDQVTHATLWRNGTTADLGTLGGPNSAVLWPVKNSNGIIAGVSETPEINKLGENWSCAFFFPAFTHHVCRGFVWQDGTMSELPTLGGPDGFATGANNRGEVAGWAENTVHDPTCQAPQVLQFRAVVWDTRHGGLTQLAPLPGDTVSAATAINNQGEAVGISGICDIAVGEFSARHAVIWRHGMARSLGSLGGVAWNTPMAINNRGEVVGFANVAGGDPAAPNFHAFVWTGGGPMRDIGTLPHDAVSEALGINDEGQVVGESCKAGFQDCRAFLWHDGVMINLNRLVAGHHGHLVFANDINNAGRITGQALDPKTGDRVAFVAAPVG